MRNQKSTENEFQERSPLPSSCDVHCRCADRARLFPESALWPLRETGSYVISGPMCLGFMFETITHLLIGLQVQENPG